MTFIIFGFFFSLDIPDCLASWILLFIYLECMF